MPALTPLARSMRRIATPHESRLWAQLRAKRFARFKFRRQQLIGPYIVDFVCHGGKLVIELDGGQHAEQIERDAARSAWLASQGFTILRFWNNEVDNNMEGVLEVIIASLSPSPLPLSHQGRGVQSSSCLSHQGRGVQSTYSASVDGEQDNRIIR